MKWHRPLAAFLVSISLWALPTPAPPPGALPPAVAAPVIFREQTLFYVKTRIASFSPEARAKAIAERLDRLASDPFRTVPPLQTVSEGAAVDIVCGDIILTTLTEDDARAEKLPLAALTRQRISEIQPALTAQTWKAKLKLLAMAALWGILATAGGIAVFLGVHFLFRWIRKRVVAIAEEKFPNFRIQKLEFISSSQTHKIILRTITLLKVLLLVVFGYVYLSVIFSLFPVTRGLAAHLVRLALAPINLIWKAILGYLPSLFLLVLIGLVTRFLLKLIHLVFQGVRSGLLRIPNFYPEWADPTYRLVRMFVFAFALVVAFPYFPGAGSGAFKGVSLFIGVVFSLGSTGLVSNAVAGILITYMRPFKMGDRIAVGDTVGDVIEKSILVTRIRTIKNVEVIVPNATLLGAQVQNYSTNASTGSLILHTTVTIGYDAPWRTIHALLIDAAASTEGLLKEPKPFVLQTSLDDFYVSYQINAYTDQATRMALVYSDLHANIQEKFNEAGVEIMSPHYRSERDGNQTTVPGQYLPEDYVAPTFKISRT